MSFYSALLGPYFLGVALGPHDRRTFLEDELREGNRHAFFAQGKNQICGDAVISSI